MYTGHDFGLFEDDKSKGQYTEDQHMASHIETHMCGSQGCGLCARKFKDISSDMTAILMDGASVERRSSSKKISRDTFIEDMTASCTDGANVGQNSLQDKSSNYIGTLMTAVHKDGASVETSSHM